MQRKRFEKARLGVGGKTLQSSNNYYDRIKRSVIDQVSDATLIGVDQSNVQ